MPAKDLRAAIERFQDAVADEARMSAAGMGIEELYGMDYWKAVDEKNAAKMDLVSAIGKRANELVDQHESSLRERYDFVCKHRKEAMSQEGPICADCGQDLPEEHWCMCTERFPHQLFPVDRYMDGAIYCSHCRKRWRGRNPS